MYLVNVNNAKKMLYWMNHFPVLTKIIPGVKNF